MRKRKSPLFAALLGFFLGPIGYVYLKLYKRAIAVLIVLLIAPHILYSGEEMSYLDETLTKGLSGEGIGAETRGDSILNKFILFSTVASLVIALDCYRLTAVINEEVEEIRPPEKPPQAVYVGQTPTQDLACPKCKISWATPTTKCPNCGFEEKDDN